jgi:hypothetical protein
VVSDCKDQIAARLEADPKFMARLQARIEQDRRLINKLGKDDTPKALRKLADRIEATGCTGVTATWCPVHGDCTCAKDRYMHDDSCPLHSGESAHGEGQ